MCVIRMCVLHPDVRAMVHTDVCGRCVRMHINVRMHIKVRMHINFAYQLCISTLSCSSFRCWIFGGSKRMRIKSIRIRMSVVNGAYGCMCYGTYGCMWQMRAYAYRVYAYRLWACHHSGVERNDSRVECILSSFYPCISVACMHSNMEWLRLVGSFKF